MISWSARTAAPLITAPVTKSWAAVSTVPPIPQGMSGSSLIKTRSCAPAPPAESAPCGQRPTAAAAAPSSRRKPLPSPTTALLRKVRGTVPLTTTVCTSSLSRQALQPTPCAKAGRPPLARKIRWTASPAMTGWIISDLPARPTWPTTAGCSCRRVRSP